ncbi:MAG TPA: 30S ribosomal protein S2 [Candidatus Cloacimonadota bacterium]|nr:30S ribosomal protein S2 [Candidatus Cloacimonadota bacterium]HOD54032.1 30S ribosomal protein S2 [Candidatus Cloacimonadota bacterium]
MTVVSMKQLLEAGVHFGHQTHKWNPKMKKYIFIKRNGIHIIDLKQTVDSINEAYQFLKDVARKGEQILFVGTKKQAQEAVEKAAQEADVSYVSYRWYGGMLTNMQTIRKSVEKMEFIEDLMNNPANFSNYTKLEQIKMRREHAKIVQALGGIRKLDRKPGAVFIVDTVKEAIAVHEARKLGIPIIGMVDTNCDPDVVDYVIPSNDDAIRAVELIALTLANAVKEGRQIAEEGAAPVQATTDVMTAEATTEATEDDLMDIIDNLENPEENKDSSN